MARVSLDFQKNNFIVDFFLIITGILITGMSENQKPLASTKKMRTNTHSPSTPDIKICVSILIDFFPTYLYHLV